MSSILSRHIFCSSLSRVSMSNQYTNMPCYTALQIIHLVNLAKYIQPFGSAKTHTVFALSNMCGCWAVKVFQFEPTKIFHRIECWINFYLIIPCMCILKECHLCSRFQQRHVIHIFSMEKKLQLYDLIVSILYWIQFSMHVYDCRNAHLSIRPHRIGRYCFNQINFELTAKMSIRHKQFGIWIHFHFCAKNVHIVLFSSNVCACFWYECFDLNHMEFRNCRNSIKSLTFIVNHVAEVVSNETIQLWFAIRAKCQ